VLYPERPVVGVGALVLEGNKILLVKRGYPPSKGRWSIPGGHVEIGETILEAARRELEEETGIIGEPLGVVNVDDAITIDERGVRYHYVLITVLLKRVGGTLRPGGDAVDVGFFELEEAKKLNLTSSVRGLIEKIEKGYLCLDKPIPVRRYSPGDY
jgi:8-oxo-dGTP diphosphatase